MSLEVHIYGPGFGETIFLRWPTAKGWHGALIDACSPDDGLWLATKLRDLELSELQFVVATHPHLDHIEGLGAGLDRAGVRVGRLFYWPGLTADYWIKFYERLGRQEGGDLQGTAQMIQEWFSFCGKHYQQHGIPGVPVGGGSGVLFSTKVNGSDFRVTAIGPWLDGMNKLVKNVSGSIGRGGEIDYEHRHANHVSIALLLEYGDAQVVLGGDMEDINWDELMEQSDKPKFAPTLVKVSHHGSSNGRIEGMWPKDTGFFHGKPSAPIAVVTPWKNGNKFLPEESVLEEIRDAGYEVFVTGHSNGGGAIRDCNSHVSVRIEANGEAQILSEWKTRKVC